MMTDLYLILHKVRGEPAFDIAEKLTFDDGEEGWLIPTSGHRAYPHDWWRLGDLADISDHPHSAPYDFIAYDEALPPELPDHYLARSATKLSGLLETLGLKKSAPNLRIRGF